MHCIVKEFILKCKWKVNKNTLKVNHFNQRFCGFSDKIFQNCSSLNRFFPKDISSLTINLKICIFKWNNYKLNLNTDIHTNCPFSKCSENCGRPVTSNCCIFSTFCRWSANIRSRTAARSNSETSLEIVNRNYLSQSSWSICLWTYAIFSKFNYNNTHKTKIPMEDLYFVFFATPCTFARQS